jgi:hypothetical protein
MRPVLLAVLAAAAPLAAFAQTPPAKPVAIEVRAMTTLAGICADYVGGKPTEGLIRQAEEAGFYRDPLVKGDDAGGHIFIWTVKRDEWPVNTIQLVFAPDRTDGKRFCEITVNNGDVEAPRLLGMVKRYATTMAKPPFELVLDRTPNDDAEGKRWSSLYERPGQKLVVSDRPQPANRYDAFFFTAVVTIILAAE